jgi:5,10-methylenetetrahydrofolate reductase
MDPLRLPVPVSFEFFPPNTPVGSEKLRTVVAELAVTKPEFFSVTYGAGGSTRERTLSTVSEIAAMGHEAAAHLSCIGATRESIREILATYRERGIRRLVALRGDLPSGTATAGEFRYASDLVRFIRETEANHWHIEVAAYPEVHPQQRYAARDLQNFADKMNAGADAAITQFFFNPDAYFHFVAVPQLRAHRAVRAARRHRDPALGGDEDGRLHGRRRVDPRLRPRRGDQAVQALDRRRRAEHPLLHAESVGAVAGDLQAAVAAGMTM